MKTNIQVLGIGESKTITKHVNKVLSQLSKEYPNTINEADVKLRYDVNTYDGGSVCEIYLKMEGKNVFLIQKGSSFEKAVNKVILKLKNQLMSALNAPEAVNQPEAASLDGSL